MFEQIVDIISKQLRAEADEIGLSTNIMEDLGADSLDVVELLMSLEEIFGVTVPDEDVPTLKTVKDIVDYVDSHQA